ncbi:MAG: crotonase/enoyl-CoA hydratase family protein [Gammaproteobacteria bacterium]|nr:crotonase/enoyl-CoA hydratase family protein [Gammaproteobacteria bacterium]
MSVDMPAAVKAKTFDQLDVEWNYGEGTVWCYMNPRPRPCFTPELLGEILRLPKHLQRLGIDRSVAAEKPCFLVYGSRVKGTFNLGGDLNLFRSLIDRRDRQGLEDYARACIDVSHQVSTGFGLPLTTISLIQGAALGGGMEGALAANLIVAERGVQMGLPEVLFNLFPGMGAYSFLSRRLGATETERVILSGKTWQAEELHEMGVIDILAEPSQGEATVRDYISERQRRSPNTMMALERVRKAVNPVTHRELEEIALIWVDAALRLRDRDLKIMDRLIRSQNKAVAQQPLADVG